MRVISKKNLATKKNKSVYDRLVSADARLRRLIEVFNGSSNKETAKLTDQINALCDKYERK